MKTQGILYATALSILLTAGAAHAADSEPTIRCCSSRLGLVITLGSANFLLGPILICARIRTTISSHENWNFE